MGGLPRFLQPHGWIMIGILSAFVLGASALAGSDARPRHLRTIRLTADQPLPIGEARKLARWWHRDGWSADLAYAWNTQGGTRLFHVTAMKEEQG